jgi:CheY-like chemotaxis protein
MFFERGADRLSAAPGTEGERLPCLLLAEDNPADVKILQRALSQAGARVDLVVVRDGQEALDYLLRQGPYANGSWRRPDLIVLDLNLPRMTGFEVLRLLRSSPDLALLPVVVLSTSHRPEDVRTAYAAGANTYIEKPFDFDRFVDVLKTVLHYWLEVALLPPES